MVQDCKGKLKTPMIVLPFSRCQFEFLPSSRFRSIRDWKASNRLLKSARTSSLFICLLSGYDSTARFLLAHPSRKVIFTKTGGKAERGWSLLKCPFLSLPFISYSCQPADWMFFLLEQFSFIPDEMTPQWLPLASEGVCEMNIKKRVGNYVCTHTLARRSCKLFLCEARLERRMEIDPQLMTFPSSWHIPSPEVYQISSENFFRRLAFDLNT